MGLRKKKSQNILHGSALNPNIASALRYKSKLDRAIEQMTSETSRELKKLFKSDIGEEYFAQDITLAAQAKIVTNALIEKFEKIFSDLSKPLANQVVEEANLSSNRALNSSLREISGDLSIKLDSLSPDIWEIFNASITENVGLIKSIPEKYLQSVQGEVMRSITSGRGLSELVPYLESYKQITKRRAKAIAYDQTRKAFNSLARGKMDKLGLRKFEWLHSGGSTHPRKDHIAMSGNIYSLDNPPIIGTMYGNTVRGFPGDLPNCRCRMLPVIQFEE